MNIIEQGKRFVQSLQQLAGRAVWRWRRCPHCGSTHTCKNGSYTRHPWFFEGRRDARCSGIFAMTVGYLSQL